MPYLSWMEGDRLVRHGLGEGSCLLGRDPAACTVARPALETLAPVHVSLAPAEGGWHLKDLSSGGTRVNGQAFEASGAVLLRDGDELALGPWRLTFTEGFPGLDGTAFVERVGDLFDEMRAQEGQGFLVELKRLYNATERLLEEADSEALERSFLEESLRLMAGDRGFFLRLEDAGGWRTIHRVGAAGDDEPPRAVLDYVAREGTAILSNRLPADPRFEGAVPETPGWGPLLCAALTEEGGQAGAIYLERKPGAPPIGRIDLATLQAFARRGSLVLRQARLRHALLLADQQKGEALAAERLESLRQLAGTLKHEINNPLAVIFMQVEMLQRKYPEEARLAKIGEMADRIRDLVQVLQKMREAPTEGYADGSSILKLR